ncbi:MAG TPA: hypothetical protein VN922_14460 [Bacteroidia bacterium]|nr:hypothetical protein [Bacteroidia bacterium]
MKDLTKLTRAELEQYINSLPDLVQMIIYGAIKERNKKYPPETN